METTQLLRPLDLPGGRRLINRIVMPPLVIWKAGEPAEATDHHVAHYTETAPGCGLVIVEATTVSPEGRLAASQLGIFEDRHIPGLARLATAIRAGGALPGIQLHHAGGRTDSEKTWGETPLVPSTPTGSPPDRETPPRELTEDEILRIVADFVRGARRAVEAGFEVLELHGAHGYLGSQFLSPRTNRRTDRWGGSLENRLRFLLEIVSGIREAVGDAALVSCRLGLAEAPGDGPRFELREGLEAAHKLETAGLDLIHISHAGGSPAPIEPAPSPESGVPVRDPILQLSRPATGELTIPVIAVGGVLTADDAESALRGGYGNLVAAGRAMLADPGWARKITAGVPTTIEPCISCAPRCFHFQEPEKCPARKRLGIGPPGSNR